MPLKYDNEMLLEPGYVHDYTKEEASELYKCSKDPLYFTKYIKIVTLDKGKQPFVPYKFQENFIKKVHNSRRFCSLQCRQSGKCLKSLTKISIKNKETNEIKEITLGELYNELN